MDGATRFVSRQLAEVERLCHHALTDEGGVTVHKQREYPGTARFIEGIKLGPRDAFHHRVHGFEVRRVGSERHVDALTTHTHITTGGAEVILDISGAVHGARHYVFELAKHLIHTLVDHVDQRVEATTVRHTDDRFGQPCLGCLVEHGVEDHHGRLASFETESFGTRIAFGQELFEGFGGVESRQDVALLIDIEPGIHPFHVLLNPLLLHWIHDVHVFDAHSAAICVAYDAQQFTQYVMILARHHARVDVSVQVPDAEVVCGWIQFGGEAPIHDVERVEVGDEVATTTIGVEDLLGCRRFDHSTAQYINGVGVAVPAGRLIRDGHRREDVIVEVVVARQQPLHPLQERARLGPLDDAMVVGGRDGDRFGYTHLGQLGRVRRHECRRIVDGPESDDGGLAGHEARH